MRFLVCLKKICSFDNLFLTNLHSTIDKKALFYSIALSEQLVKCQTKGLFKNALPCNCYEGNFMLASKIDLKHLSLTKSDRTNTFPRCGFYILMTKSRISECAVTPATAQSCHRALREGRAQCVNCAASWHVPLLT